MNDNDKSEIRRQAVKLFLGGENPGSICNRFNRSKPWLYKWLKRYKSGDDDWFEGLSHRPKHHPKQTPEHLENTVINVRKKLAKTLYSQIGANAIQWEMKKLGLKPLPVSTINHILQRNGLINKRQKYESKGKVYPEIGLDLPGSVHQMDIVGPRYLKGDGLFYSHNLIDAYSHQISLLPSRTKGDDAAVNTLIKAWQNMDIPEYLHIVFIFRSSEKMFAGFRRISQSESSLQRFAG